MKASALLWKKNFQRWFITNMLTVLIRITGYTVRVRHINNGVLKIPLKNTAVLLLQLGTKTFFSVSGFCEIMI